MNFQRAILAKSLARLNFTMRFSSHEANFNEVFGRKISANLKNIFVSPYPTLVYQYGLVGRSENYFFLISQIGYPLNLIVYSKTCLKRSLKKQKKMCVFSRPIIT